MIARRPIVLGVCLVVVAGAAITFAAVRPKLGELDGDDPKPRSRAVIDYSLSNATDPPPALKAGRPLQSQLLTQAQLETPLFRQWIEELKEPFHYHNKVWEYVFIAQALDERGMLAAGKRGVGFGVGREPLPALFAKHGAEVVATDLDLAQAEEKGWVRGNQYMTSLDVLNTRGVVPDADFKRLVTARNVDMTRIPEDLRGYDFLWSTCALGHLGNLEKGLQFIEHSLAVLKPGGIAVHTTEFNLSSNTTTWETTNTAVYRKRDIEELVRRLTAEGHEVHVSFNFDATGALDNFIDDPPYRGDKHLRLRINRYVVTSLGLIIRKNPRASN